MGNRVTSKLSRSIQTVPLSILYHRKSRNSNPVYGSLLDFNMHEKLHCCNITLSSWPCRRLSSWPCRRYFAGYITATMVTHCSIIYDCIYKFSVNAFRVIKRVTISVSTLSVKKILVSSKQKALQRRVNVHR